MKKLTTKSILLIAATVLTLTACKKNTDAIAPQNNSDVQKITAFFKANAPQFETFTVDAAAGGTVTTTKGSKFKIPANVFVTASGAAVTGSVDISVKEIGNASAMILGDKPTLTADGRMLISYGEFFIKASQNNQELLLKKDSAIKAQVPAKPAGVQEVPMWAGDSIVNVTLNGYDYQNNATTVTSQVGVRKGIDWTQIPGGWAQFNGGTGTFGFAIDSLVKWRNCDALYNDPRPKTTVFCYYGDHYNPVTHTNYSGVEPTMVFFKPTNQNTVIKFYNVILNAPAGKQGLHSYQASMPIGLTGTFLAISAIDGKFYAEVKDNSTIAAPDAGKTYSSFSFSPQEVSESALLALINGMNAK